MCVRSTCRCMCICTAMTTKTSPSSSSSSSSSRTCLCSPTNHPGSFRCSLHRAHHPRKASAGESAVHDANANRSKTKTMMMATSSSKPGLLKAFLMQIIKPSSHHLQRRRNFQPRPTRFCLMNSGHGGGHDGVAVS